MDGTTHHAIGTDRLNLSFGDEEVLRQQGSGGTMFHAFATTLADGLGQWLASKGADHGIVTPVAEVNRSNAHDLITPTHALSTEDAFVRVKIISGIGPVR